MTIKNDKSQIAFRVFKAASLHQPALNFKIGEALAQVTVTFCTKKKKKQEEGGVFLGLQMLSSLPAE